MFINEHDGDDKLNLIIIRIIIIIITIISSGGGRRLKVGGHKWRI